LRFKAAVPLLMLLLTVGLAPMTAAAQAGNSSNITLTVNPDGSVAISLEGSTVSSGSSPFQSFNIQESTSPSSSGITINLQATFAFNQTLVSQPPYDSGTFTASGSYQGGVSSGTITVQGVSGVSSPISSFHLTYQGTSSSLTASGSTTVQYGTYTEGTTQVEVNQSYVSQVVTIYQQQINASVLNQDLAHLNANVTVNTFTISPTYNSNSADISVQVQVSGDIAELPLLYIEAASGASGQGATMTASERAALQAYGEVLSSFQDYTYTASYSSGTLSLSAKIDTASNLNLNQAMGMYASEGGLTGSMSSQSAFVSGATVDISNFNFRETGSVSGGVTAVAVSASGFVIHPAVTVESSGAFNESGLFQFLGSFQTSPANVTLKAGSPSVVLDYSGAAVAPSSTTSNSATWTNVQWEALSGVGFSAGSSVTTTTGQTTTTQTSPGSTTTTTTTTPASGGGGIPEFPFQLAGVLLVTLLVVAAYALARRTTVGRKGTFEATH
jgi:hypothetical protein